MKVYRTTSIQNKAVCLLHIYFEQFFHTVGKPISFNQPIWRRPLIFYPLKAQRKPPGESKRHAETEILAQGSWLVAGVFWFELISIFVLGLLLL